MNLSTLSVTIDGARYTAETLIQPTIPEDGLGRLAGGKKRLDTNVYFEVVVHDDAPYTAEARGGRKRQDTSFTFEIAASDPSTAEAPGSPKRKSASFDFERTATPTDGGLTITEIQESLGNSDLPDEAPAEARTKRNESSFSSAVATPGGGTVSATVRVSVLETAGE